MLHSFNLSPLVENIFEYFLELKFLGSPKTISSERACRESEKGEGGRWQHANEMTTQRRQQKGNNNENVTAKEQ